MEDVPLSEMGPQEFLRTRRRALGISQHELAQRAGTAQSVIAAIERVQRRLTPTMETKLRRLMRAHPADLLQKHRDQVLAEAAAFGFTNVRVFGSIARGDATEDSDIDLFVDFDDPETGDIFGLFRLGDRLENLLAVPVDVKLAPSYLDRAPRAAEAVQGAVAI